MNEKSCVGCKFLYSEEEGYSNYTWVDTEVRCARDKNQNLPAPRLRWAEAPRRTEWGAGMMEALIALGVDETLRLYAHRDAVPMVDALLSAPARVPLTGAEIASIQRPSKP